MSIRTTTSSYVVLLLVEQLEPATAYDLKRLASSSVFNFWALQHTALYTETQRLYEAGLLSVDEEDGGRRRRRFSLTPVGREILDEWRDEPTEEQVEIRDPGLLRLFAGAEPRALAATQLARHRAQLESYLELDEALKAGGDDLRNQRSVLTAGIAIEMQYVAYWSRVAEAGHATSDELPFRARD